MRGAPDLDPDLADFVDPVIINLVGSGSENPGSGASLVVTVCVFTAVLPRAGQCSVTAGWLLGKKSGLQTIFLRQLAVGNNPKF